MASWNKYEEKVEAALLPVVLEAIFESPNAVSYLRQALEEYTKKVHATHQNMTCCPGWHCSDCGRYWTVVTTVETERTRPDNCPECFNKGGGLKSCWTDYKYISEDEANALREKY
jgi:hypothetical protein